MPDVNSIPFRQANGNGHYTSKQLPNNNADFLAILGLPTSIGNVTSASASSLDGQLAAYWGTSGSVIKASTLIGIVDLVDGKVTTRLSPTGDVVGTTAIQTLSNKTLTNASIVSPSGLTKADVGLGNVDNTSDVAKPVSTAQQTALNLKENIVNKNVANGYAGLDATGKVALANLPTTVQGSVSYQGTWNATTNVPAIPAASAGNRGWYYVVSVAGTVSISGVADWGVGDWLVSNGTSWDKADHTDAVSSVAGQTGAVVLTKSDVGLGNVDNTSDVAKNSAAGTLTNKTINGTSNTLTVRLDSDVANNLPVNRLNNGIGATDQSWWCGDGTWKSPAGAGDVVGPPGAADTELAIYNGSTGKLLKRLSQVEFIHLKPPKSTILDNLDEFVIWDSVNGTLKAITGSNVIPPGTVIQTVYAPPNANYAVTATVIPNDDTIPQFSEGNLCINGTITPRFSNSNILLTFNAICSASVQVIALFPLFRGSGPDAIGIGVTGIGNDLQPVGFTCLDAPGVATAVTYSVRYGPNTAATLRVNGTSVRLWGGVMRTTLCMQEIKA